MCECGCAEGMNPQWTFAGPKGFTYALAFYTGCRDCDNPPGLMLYKIPTAQLRDEQGDWGPSDWRVPLRLHPVFDGKWEEVAIGFAWPDDMRKALREAGVDEYAETDDLLFDVAHEAKRRFEDQQEKEGTELRRREARDG